MCNVEISSAVFGIGRTNASSLYSQIEFHKNITSITQIIYIALFHFKFFIQTMHRVATQNSHKSTDKTKDILNVG